MSAALASGVLDREPRAIARALSAVTDDPVAGAMVLADLRRHTGHALLVGVTGPPGAGKSTLVDRLIKEIRQGGRTVGVLAVDPTSPFSGGALLGDRVRMQAHASDPGVFIRSLATRGKLGGLSSTTADAALVLDAAGFDVVLIETVGVGQDEIDIAGLADVRVVVLVPDAGDDVQDMKAGLLEIGDIFVVNKSDRVGADRTVAALEKALRLSSESTGDWTAPVLSTTATDGTGVVALLEAIDRFRAEMDDRLSQRRSARHAAKEIAALQGAVRGRIDHIGVAVSDPAPLVSFLAKAFGAEPGPAIEASSHRVRVRFVPLGSSSVEVIEALDPDASIAAFLARRGPGLHHLAIEVEDLDTVLADLRAKGVRLVNEAPRPGADGRAIAFIHPSAAGGVLVELVQMRRGQPIR